MMLIERLVGAAEIWAAEHERSLSRLATIVVNDGKLFDRITAGGSCTVATYERLMGHLRDPANWSKPIPANAVEMLHMSDLALHEGRQSSGTSSEISQRSAA